MMMVGIAFIVFVIRILMLLELGKAYVSAIELCQKLLLPHTLLISELDIVVMMARYRRRGIPSKSHRI